MRYLGDVCEGRDNGFNLLRLVAASSILAAHCILVVPVMSLEEAAANPNIRTGVDILLAVFFVFSGFLITGSMERNSNILRFSIARALRIFPGLLFVSLALAFVVGPFTSSLPMSEYFSSLQTWLFAPALGVFLDQGATLPGVFEQHPVAAAVNMPIWTLRYEVAIYAAFPFIYHLLLTGRSFVRGMTLITLFGAAIALKAAPIFDSSLTIESQAIENFINFGSSFFIGVGLWIYRKNIPYGFHIVAVLWGLFAMSAHLEIGILFGVMAAGYSFIWVAFVNLKILRSYNALGDYSYGIYIIHFPVAQVIYGQNPSIDPVTLTYQTFVMTLTLAMLLWVVCRKALSIQRQKCSFPSGCISRRKRLKTRHFEGKSIGSSTTLMVQFVTS